MNDDLVTLPREFSSSPPSSRWNELPSYRRRRRHPASPMVRIAHRIGHDNSYAVAVVGRESRTEEEHRGGGVRVG